MELTWKGNRRIEGRKLGATEAFSSCGQRGGALLCTEDEGAAANKAKGWAGCTARPPGRPVGGP